MDGFTIVGVIATTLLVLCVASVAWSTFKQFVVAWIFGTGLDLKSLGTWAVVTGSTDGIGKAYAEELAKAGLNICLISRSLEKLKTVAKEIETSSHVKTKIIVADFTDGFKVYGKIKEELAELDIAVLVNNVAVFYENYPTPFLNGTLEEMNDIISVNCGTATFLTAMVLPAMLAKGKGAIVNVSSVAGNGMPGITVYSSTKAFLTCFSNCLREEYGDKGITVQNVEPGFVATNLVHLKHGTLLIPSAKAYGRAAVPTLGRTDTTSGCLLHHIQGVAIKCMPYWLYYKYIAFIMNYAASTRKQQQSKKYN
jgi:17beta-estradiol 17-dehydrogenase / very-long-chain 3-oxoacyl-CoA reductase